MMEGWKEYKVEEIADVVGGGTPSSKIDEYWNGDISWITPNDLSGYSFKSIKNGSRNISKFGLQKSSAKLHPINTVLLTSRAPIGYLAIAKKEVATNQGFQSLRCNNDLADYNFIYYYLNLYRGALASIASGATFPELSGKKLKQFKITIPLPPTQHKIAAILSAYDDLIENNLKRIKLLEEMAQNTYEEWFVRFKIDGVKLTIDEKTGLPEGWRKVKLGEIIDVGRGSSPRPIADQIYFDGGTIPWLKIADATASHIYIYKTKEYVNEYGASFSRKLPAGSLIVAASGTLGFPMFLGVEGCIHDGWIYFDGIKEEMKEYFYFSFINLKKYFEAISYGAAIQNINTGIVKGSPLILPSNSVLELFHKYGKRIFVNIENLQTQNQNLKEARDILLPRLMTGMIDVEKMNLYGLNMRPMRKIY